MELLWW